MAKRFVDTEKFTDPWFRRLSTKNKLLWDWMLCSCDHAGFISIDLEFVEMVLGEKFDDQTIESFFHDRVLKLGDFKFFIPKFIKFQYGKLNPESRVHISVIKKLSDHGIDYTRLDTLSIPYPACSDRVKDKEKEKDKDSSFLISSFNTEEVKGSQLSPDNVIQLFNDECAGKGKISHCRGFSKKTNEDFFITTSYAEFRKLDTWQEVFLKTGDSPFLTGQQPGSNFVATLNWLVIHDNALKVLNGQYGKADNQNAFKANPEHRKPKQLTAREIQLLTEAGQI